MGFEVEGDKLKGKSSEPDNQLTLL